MRRTSIAATPWIEIALVIPPAIGLGMDPIGVGVVAFLGNAIPVLGIVAFHRQIASWWVNRRGDDEQRSGRYRRARRVWDRFGVAGLGLAAPVVTGVHLAAVFALLLGSPPRRVAVWMCVGIAVWAVVLVAATVFGLSLVGLR